MPVTAQDCPSKPIRLIVPSAAGGTFGILVRTITDEAIPRLGASSAVGNKPGASGLIGMGAFPSMQASTASSFCPAVYFTSTPGFVQLLGVSSELSGHEAPMPETGDQYDFADCLRYICLP